MIAFRKVDLVLAIHNFGSFCVLGSMLVDILWKVGKDGR